MEPHTPSRRSETVSYFCFYTTNNGIGLQTEWDITCYTIFLSIALGYPWRISTQRLIPYYRLTNMILLQVTTSGLDLEVDWPPQISGLLLWEAANTECIWNRTKTTLWTSTECHVMYKSQILLCYRLNQLKFKYPSAVLSAFGFCSMDAITETTSPARCSNHFSEHQISRCVELRANIKFGNYDSHWELLPRWVRAQIS